MSLAIPRRDDKQRIGSVILTTLVAAIVVLCALSASANAEQNRHSFYDGQSLRCPHCGQLIWVPYVCRVYDSTGKLVATYQYSYPKSTPPIWQSPAWQSPNYPTYSQPNNWQQLPWIVPKQDAFK
jgi:hypothetical protein